ncbi:MAG: CHASE2 domain-containing protein [Cyanobacteria bacterium P01_C01_bin.89]
MAGFRKTNRRNGHGSTSSKDLPPENLSSKDLKRRPDPFSGNGNLPDVYGRRSAEPLFCHRRSPVLKRRRIRWSRPLRRLIFMGLGVAVSTLALRGLGLFQRPELDLYDLMTRLRPMPVAAPVVVVGFDEAFVSQPGAWPISDALLAQLLTGIASANPAAIGLDLYRDVPVKRGGETLRQLYRTLPNLYGIQRLEDRDTPRIRAPEILDRKDQVGFNNMVIDADGRLRRSILYMWKDGQGYQSLPLKLAEHYLAADNITVTLDKNNLDLVRLGPTLLPFLERNSGSYQQADTNGYQIFADFRGGRGTVPMVLARDIIDGNFDPTLLNSRVVLVGVVADSIKDVFHTPYSSTTLESKPPVFGVEIQAQLVAQLLDLAQGNRPLIQSWSEGAEIMWTLLWCIAGAALAAFGKSPLRTSVWGVVGAAQLGVLGYVCLLWGWWIPVVPPLVGGLTTLVIVTVLNAQQQYELERSKDFLNSIIAAVPEPVFVQDSDHRWVVLNPAFEELVGYPLGKLINQRPEAVLPPSSAEMFQALDQNLTLQGKPLSQESHFLNRHGRELTVILKRSLHSDRAGNSFLVGTLQDITAQKRLEQRLTRRATELRRYNEQLQRSHQELHHKATHDPLTNLGNRQYIHHQLRELTIRSQAEQETFSVLFLDLDGFKAVNDRWGHQAGDDVLVETARRLVDILREGDVIGRLAGDEFVVVLPKVPYTEVAERVAHKIIGTIAQPFEIAGDHRTSSYGVDNDQNSGEAIAPSQTNQSDIAHVTVSVGIAFFPEDAITPDQLIAAADYAMLSAKSKGKNNCQYYETLKPVDLEHSRHRLDAEPLEQDALETTSKIPTA